MNTGHEPVFSSFYSDEKLLEFSIINEIFLWYLRELYKIYRKIYDKFTSKLFKTFNMKLGEQN